MAAARALKVGDSGADVSALQRALNRLAETRFYPPLAPDGEVGPATMRAFQALGWALGFTEQTLNGPTIPIRAQQLIRKPEERSPQDLARARRRAPGLHLRTIAFDGTPTFWGLAKPLLLAREHGWSGQLDSSDRRKGVAERFGKKSQATLFACAKAKKNTGRCPSSCSGDCNPANQPGQSSHELRSDASAFPGPLGRKLNWFELGLDISDHQGALDALNHLGYKARLTYPHSIKELHHINFTASPGRVLPDVGPASHATHPSTAPVAVHTHRAPGPLHRGHPASASHDGALITLTGPDVSFNQDEPIDWHQVKTAGHDFAMHRATDGLNSPDKKFGKARWTGMKDAGLVRGAYHVGRPQTRRDPKDEVAEFLNRLKEVGGLHEGDLVPILDIEAFGSIGRPLNATDTRRWVHLWTNEMFRRIGRHPIIYTGNFWRDTMKNGGDNYGCRLWLAAYVKQTQLHKFIPIAWHNQGITIWQHTDTGTCPGIHGACDLNRYTGTRAIFDQLRM
jgi:lysozyme